MSKSTKALRTLNKRVKHLRKQKLSRKLDQQFRAIHNDVIQHSVNED